MEKLFLTVAKEDIGQRIDRFVLGHAPHLSRSAVQKLCESGNILVNGVSVAKNHKMQAYQEVIVEMPGEDSPPLLAQALPLDIFYEDDDVLVVNKPKGMVVHPALGNADGTMVNALLHHCGDTLRQVGEEERPGIVHRIDKDTSGLLLVAKSELGYAGLSQQIKAHSVTRRYHAVMYGNLKTDSGRIDAPIGRHPVHRKKLCVTEQNSREAVTLYTVLERLDGFTYAELELKTGRTHQIRVHLAHLGHPVAGDPVYGPKKVITRLGGQCLLAKTVGFLHPRTGEYLEFTAPLPDYFTTFLRGLRGTNQY